MSNLVRGGVVPQDLTQAGLLGNLANYPAETMEVLSNFEMPSNMAIGNFSGINNTGMPNFTSSLSVGDIGGLGSEGLLGGLLGGLTNDMNLGDWMGVLGGIGQLYLGNKQMGLLEDVLNQNLAMAKEKQGWTRDELSRVNRVRNNLNTGYRTGNYGVSPTAKTYS